MIAFGWGVQAYAKQPISRYMTRDVISVGTDDSFSSVRDLMEAHRIRHVPVVNQKKLVGIISKVDLYRYTFNEEYETDRRMENAYLDMTTSLAKIMSTNVITAVESSPTQAVAEKMIQYDIHSVPIVNAEHELVGIVTSTDLLKLFLQIS